MDGWEDSWRIHGRFMAGAEGEGRGEHRFMKLMKLKIKGENYAVFYFTGKRIFFYIYDVITWGKNLKSSAYHYSGLCVYVGGGG